MTFDSIVEKPKYVLESKFPFRRKFLPDSHNDILINIDDVQIFTRLPPGVFLKISHGTKVYKAIACCKENYDILISCISKGWFVDGFLDCFRESTLVTLTNSFLNGTSWFQPYINIYKSTSELYHLDDEGLRLYFEINGYDSVKDILENIDY